MEPLKFGKFRIEEPCTVPESELLGSRRGQQFCNRCQKVVHDISGWEPRQVEALYKAHGGKVCAAFFETLPPLARNRPRASGYRLLPQWLTGAAATVTLSWLLLRTGEAQAASPSAPITIVQPAYKAEAENLVPSSPLLLSSVILDQDTFNIQDDVVLTLTLPNGRVKEIVTSAGFFALNLEGLAQADDTVQVDIAAQKFEDYSGSRTYPAMQASFRADAAQNQTLQLQVVYKYTMKNRGAMRR